MAYNPNYYSHQQQAYNQQQPVYNGQQIPLNGMVQNPAMMGQMNPQMNPAPNAYMNNPGWQGVPQPMAQVYQPNMNAMPGMGVAQPCGYPQHLMNFNAANYNFGQRPVFSKYYVKEQLKNDFTMFTAATRGQLFYNQLYPFLTMICQRVGTLPVTPQQCDYLWYMHDSNRSGTLDYKETKRLVKNMSGLSKYKGEKNHWNRFNLFGIKF